MEQRTLRLGDIVDDYCPRERRVTNHAIVAIVENSIRQTRCSTCEAEHEYKEAKVPKKRTRADGSDLAGGVLVTPKAATNGAAPDNTEPNGIREPEAPAAAAVASNGAESPAAPADEGEAPEADDPGPVIFTHRPLIRASLPKTDGEPPPQRPAPEFTMHQRHGRGFGGGGGGRGGFRHGHSFHSNGSQPFRGHQNNNGNGNEPDGNRDPQAVRPPGAPGGPGGGGGGRRRRRRRR